MAGVNRYYSQVRLANATALDESAAQTLLRKSAAALRPQSPCVFLSHKSEDKEAVKKIGDYIKEQGVDIYLDIDDPNLQKAVRDRDDAAITRFIEIGVRSSTDLMTVISEKTKGSWWVPYEVGFGRSGGIPVATMKLKDVTGLPSFLTITRVLNGSKSLDRYIDEIKKRQGDRRSLAEQTADILLESQKAGHFGSRPHPLSAYLRDGM